MTVTSNCDHHQHQWMSTATSHSDSYYQWKAIVTSHSNGIINQQQWLRTTTDDREWRLGTVTAITSESWHWTGATNNSVWCHLPAADQPQWPVIYYDSGNRPLVAATLGISDRIHSDRTNLWINSNNQQNQPLTVTFDRDQRQWPWQ